MKKTSIKTIGVVVGIYILDYLFTGMIGLVGGIAVGIYGFRLSMKKDLVAVKTLLLSLVVINIIILFWVLFM